MKSGSSAKYPTLTVEELCALPIPDIADKNSVLFLWATVPLMPEAFEVVKAWKYKYKTSLFWRKTGRVGLGFWWRGEVELLLFGIRGKVKAFRCQEPNYIETRPTQHSSKPEEFRQLIERATADIENPKKVEIFGRRQAEGWDVIGNDIDGKDIRDVLKNLTSVN